MLEEQMEISGVELGVLEMCRKCYSFRYDNGWHFERPDNFDEINGNDEVEGTTVQFSQCPSCIEEDIAVYEMEYV